MFRTTLLLLSFLLLASPAMADNPVDRLQDFYSTLRDAEGPFIQNSRIKELNKTTSYKGYFYLKQNRLFIDYKGQNPQKVYITGPEIIIYNEAQRTAFKMPFDERRYGQTPIALLRGLTDIKADFDIKVINDKRLSLRLLKGGSTIERIELTLSDAQDFPLSSLVMTDNSGNTTEILFKGGKVNQGISDKVFRFNPPQGTTVVEQGAL